MAKSPPKKQYSAGVVMRNLYASHVSLRRFVNLMMRTSGMAIFFFLIGNYQRFTTPSQYLLLDIARYTASLAFVATIFIIIVRLSANSYHKARISRLVLESFYMFLILLLVVVSSSLRVWFEGTLAS
jgi:hypothetical protein